MPENTTIKQLTAQAYDHVFDNHDTFIDAVACEFACVNMGQEIHVLLEGYPIASLKPATLFVFAWSGLQQNAEEDISDEYASWKKEATKLVARIAKAKLPFTVKNAQLAWENKGPFTKKAKK